MSKNITIQEGGVARSFGSVDKLQTSLQGGGTCLWVPEDETKLTTKHVSKNGTYTAASDGHYGYSKVTVNVPGGSGSANSSGKPSTLDGGDIAPGGAGSAIVGTDPETGNEQVVGVDEQGNLVTTSIPSYMEIITEPDDTEYNEGDTIIYDGIVVGLKKKDGTTFTDSRYMNGHIPMGELIFPVEKAPAGSGISHDGTDSADYPFTPARIDFPLVESPGGASHQQSRGDIVEIVAPSNVKIAAFATFFDGNTYVDYYAASTEPATIQEDRNGSITTITLLEKNVYGKSFYATRSGFWQRVGDLQLISGTWNDYRSNPKMSPTVDQVAYIMLYGKQSGGTALITVKWKSPYDGRQLEDKFEITVTSAPEGS